MTSGYIYMLDERKKKNTKTKQNETQREIKKKEKNIRRVLLKNIKRKWKKKKKLG